MFRIQEVMGGHGIGGASSNIKSIQEGTSTAGIIAISPIDITKSILIVDQPNTNYGFIVDSASIHLYGTSIIWRVITFNNVKSLQRGNTQVLTSLDVTIAAINPLKSLMTVCYYPNNLTSYPSGYVYSGYIKDAVTITLSHGMSQNEQMYWEVIEFN